LDADAGDALVASTSALGATATKKSRETLACLEVALMRARMSSDNGIASALAQRIVEYEKAHRDVMRVVSLMATLARAIESDQSPDTLVKWVDELSTRYHYPAPSPVLSRVCRDHVLFAPWLGMSDGLRSRAAGEARICELAETGAWLR